LGENITSKYISSNFCYRKNKTSIFNPYKIIEKGGKKIAFIGVLTPLTFSKTSLSTFRDSNGDAIYDFLTDNNGQELIDRVQENVNKVRNEEGADYVILLTHIGMELEEYTSEGLLSKIENVDAVLDGHTHLIYNTTTKDINNKDIHISQTGTKLQSIGKLIIKSTGAIISEIIQVIPEPSDKTNAIKVTRGGKEIWVNKDMNNFINGIFDIYKDELNILYGSSEYDLVIRPEGTTDSHFIYCRYQECTVGNLLADAFKTAGNSDAAIINGGAVRSSIKKEI
jgi:2',3'-cyclic-nucleotide 2'-phosphodiesterase (5'-nucleotidase family)